MSREQRQAKRVRLQAKKKKIERQLAVLEDQDAIEDMWG
jgi:hypothetical protein